MTGVAGNEEDMVLAFALNHMTVARHSFADLLEIASALGCVGVECRNDLPGPLFDGRDPAEAGQMLRDRGLRLLALAEVKRFNDWTADRQAEALDLMRTARAAGAEAVSLIPRNDNGGMGNGERQANLRIALRALGPKLEDHGLVGLVEPLGFDICALRHKEEGVAAIESLGAAGTFRLVHDTFHHHLSGDARLFPAHTGIVHISGVVDPGPSAAEMTDADRVLVDPQDRLDNVGQIAGLLAAGYDGPISFEAFAPSVHETADPVGALSSSIAHLRSRLTEAAA